MTRIALVDYGAGNLLSVRKALEAVGGKVIVARTADAVMRADAVVLPGVGAFSCVARLGRMRGAILDSIAAEKPFLGICLGMQALFEKSEESASVRGLGVFPGSVERLRGRVKIPHIGWNTVKLCKCELFDGIDNNAYFYFDHSYAVKPKDKRIIAATCSYGRPFAAVLACKNTFATQFHPEKSGAAGLRLLENFVRLCR